MAIFTGAGVAIITPFTTDFRVNYEKLGEIIDYQIENGTDAIIICGTTGESATLSMEEHKKVIRYTVQRVNKRIPVIAGTGSNCTETAIELSRDAERDGADGLLVVTPYYNKATQQGLIEHYSLVAESVHLPIIMYNVPSRTGCCIQPETAVEIAKRNPNIVAIKDATGNLSQTTELAYLSQREGNCLDIYSGNDDEIIPCMSVGGIGVISVLSNVVPRETHEMTKYYLDGEIEKARDLQLKYLPLVRALFSEVNPIPVKAAMNLLGMEVGPLRRPLTEIEPGHREQLKDAMKEVGLLS